jgi:AraC family transcriptional regulator
MLGHVERSCRVTGRAIDVDILKRKSWPGFAAEFVRIPATTAHNFKLRGARSCIALLDLYRTDGETCAAGLDPTFTKDLRHKITFVPAGCTLEGWCTLDKAATITVVAIDPNAKLERWVDVSQLPPRIEFMDQTLRWAMLRFRALLNDPDQDTPGYAETLVELLSHDLGRVVAAMPRQQPAGCGLNASQVRIVTEYIDAHLFERPTISDLAALVDLTRFHFIRSFKKAVGMPPHQFMIHRSVDRAKELLAEQGQSVANVAARTGFGSPIQLTRAFRRVVGTTPTEFRRHIL